MEIYVNQTALQSMQDIVTRKYGEFLYIIAELEKIYGFLDDNIRANNEIYSKYRALMVEMSGLALELKRHREFLSDAESEYNSTEKAILREAESIPDFTFIPAKYTSMAAPVVQLLGSQSQPDLASFGVSFSYIPSKALETINVNTEETEDTDSIIIKTVEWKDEYTERSGTDYMNAVTLSSLNQDNLPKTREEYMKAVFNELGIGYPDGENGDFPKQSIITELGWYPTTKEDALGMAMEGYPSVICGESGFMGFVSGDSAQIGSDITVYSDLGKHIVRTMPNTFFYIHS